MILDENEKNSEQKIESGKYHTNIKILGFSIFATGVIFASSLLYFFYSELFLYSDFYISDFFNYVIPFLLIIFINFSVIFSGYKLIQSKGEHLKVISGLKWLIAAWCSVFAGGILAVLS